jgi:quinone-modifying oxidoreductase, subunit QmoC
MTALSAPSAPQPPLQKSSFPSVIQRAGNANKPAMELKRTIKYESDRVKGFGREVMSVPGCEQLENCIQCGTCSGLCPLSIFMDQTPRQVMELTRSDFKNEVLQSTTIWLCASCYACTVECPKQIRITDIMYELKQRAIHEGFYPKRFPIPVLAQEFYKMSHKRGRVTENFLATIMFLKTNILAALGMWRLGLNLLRRGRFPLKLEGIKRKDELERMMAVVDKLSIDALNNGHQTGGNGGHQHGAH